MVLFLKICMTPQTDTLFDDDVESDMEKEGKIPRLKQVKWQQWEKMEYFDGKERLEKIQKIGLPSELNNVVINMI